MWGPRPRALVVATALLTGACGSAMPAPVVVGSHSLAVDELRAGRVDAVVGDQPVLALAAHRSDGELRIAGPPFDVSDVGIAARRDGDALAGAIEGALGSIVADGTYGRILDDWGVAELALESPPPSPAASPAVGALPELADGVLQVGIEMGGEPMEFRREGEDRGVDVELARALGERLGVEVELVNHEEGFDALIPSLERGDVDVLISSITITEERAARVRFVPYARLGSVILVRSDSSHPVSGLRDLCGLRVAVQRGTTQEVRVDELRARGCAE